MLKLGYNEATCKENSTVENDLLLCEKYGYDYIELRLDMLQEYLKTHTVDDLKAFFAKSHISHPLSLNAQRLKRVGCAFFLYYNPIGRR